MFMEFNPVKNGYAVFVAGDNEHLIYTPRLGIPMKLCLKSGWYVETDRIEYTISASERPQVMEYRNHLEERLKERKVPFTLVQPN